MLDYATLTGACVYALSERYSGVFTNREPLNDLLVRPGASPANASGRSRTTRTIDDDLKSKMADVAQCATSR